jgi:proto-oncogene tyrosine-protein kinase ROS
VNKRVSQNLLIDVVLVAGKGAWQNWSYELHITDETVGVTVYKKNVNATSYTIQHLKANTEYVIKVGAYTSSGKGPWSSEFRGKTLKIPQDDKYPSILWSAAEGLLKSDVTGENVEMLIHNTNLKVCQLDVTAVKSVLILS